MGSSQSSVASDTKPSTLPDHIMNPSSSTVQAQTRHVSPFRSAAVTTPIRSDLPERGAEIESFNVKSHGPVPLTASQEAQVRDIYYKRVRDKCATEVREFAQCAAGRTFTIPFACRQQRLGMERCMNSYANQAEEDAAREEWFAGVGTRRREAEMKDAEKQETKRKHREWWDLDPQGRRIQRTADSGGREQR